MQEHAEKPVDVENGTIEELEIHVMDLTLHAAYRSVLEEYGCRVVSLRKEKETDPACRILFPPGVRVVRAEEYCSGNLRGYDLFFPNDFYFTWHQNRRESQVWNSLNIPLHDLPIKK